MDGQDSRPTTGGEVETLGLARNSVSVTIQLVSHTQSETTPQFEHGYNLSCESKLTLSEKTHQLG